MEALTTTLIVDGLMHDDRFDDCWGLLHERFREYVAGRAIGSGLTRANAEDLADAVIERVARSVQAGNYAKRPSASFRSWLNRVALNAIRDFVKANKKRISLDPSVLEAIVDEATTATLETELADLDPDLHRRTVAVKNSVEAWEWLAFFRTGVRQLPAKDVAEQLSVAPSQVYQATFKVRRRLQRVLGET